MIVVGSAFRVSTLPRMFGSDAKRRCQYSAVIRATRGARGGLFSSILMSRPSKGRMPRVSIMPRETLTPRTRSGSAPASVTFISLRQKQANCSSAWLRSRQS